MKAAKHTKATGRKRRWVVFSNGSVHGVQHSELVMFRRLPNRSMLRSSVSIFTVSRAFGIVAGLGMLIVVLLLLAGCQMPRAQKGGRATTTINHAGHSNTSTLDQSENPKEPSRQTVQSEQTMEYVLPPGSAIQLPALAPAPGSTGLSAGPCVAMLRQAVPVRLVAKDRSETSIGGAQKDALREWAGKAANMQPVMWAGIVMMTLIAGVLIYFGWWTKAAMAAAVGIAMVVLAQTLPDHGSAILLGGLGVFALSPLLVLYAYYKGQLDRNQNGISDFLEKNRGEQT